MSEPNNNNMPQSGGPHDPNTNPYAHQTPHVAGAQQPAAGYQATYGQPAHGTQPAQPAGAASPAHGTQPAAAASHATHAHSVPMAGGAYAPAAAPSAAGKGGGLKTFALGFAGALVACALFFGVSSCSGALDSGSNAGSEGSGSAGVVPVEPPASMIDSENEDPTLAEAVAAKCLPSVAAIDVYASSADVYGQQFGFGFGMGSSSDELVEYSLGSGVVLTEDGYIITNNHVIEGGSAFTVTIDGQSYEAELVGADPSSDVAVLKAKDASGLAAIEVGDSDDLIIGEWVMSIGSPFGLEQSVATGIVSATSRSQIMGSSGYGSSGEMTIYPNMIQTDAAINPGNSGGALVDAQGRLIGINTLITSYSGNYSGVGFAIPVNYAVNLADQIIAGEKPTHAQLGVSLTTINASIAERYGFTVDAGAYVTAVNRGSGAADAGLREGDIVIAFDGKPVESASDLMLDVRTKNPGDTVMLTVNRDGQDMEVQVTLGSDAQSETHEGSWLYEMFRHGNNEA